MRLERPRQAAGRQGLHDKTSFQPSETATSLLFRNVYASEAQVSRLFIHINREMLRFVPFSRVWLKVFFGKLVCHFLDHNLILV